MLFFILLIIQAIALYFLSRQTINEIFYFLRLFIKEEKVNYVIVTILFLPGTILHELGHFFMAIVLFMRVRDLRIFPEFKDDEIKLGHVLYEKQDPVRGVIIGIAPIFAAMFLFWCLAYFQLFPNQNILVSLLLGYLIFAVSSTMFSSKQDLVDLVFIIPFILLAALFIYIFNIKIDFLFKNPNVYEGIMVVINRINVFYTFSFVLHGLFILLLRLGRNIIRK